MNVLDLFSGIGGFSLGLERAGMRTIAFCEIDPFCQRILEKHWPGVPIHHDVTKLRGSDIGAVDVICGGFPCQDISSAGHKVGIGGKRSGLWKQYARLIGELRPRFVIVENTAGLLARGMDQVLGDLARLRYDAAWFSIPASSLGALHDRARVWIVAHPNNESQSVSPEHDEARGLSPAGEILHAQRWQLALGRFLARARRERQSLPWDRVWPDENSPMGMGVADGIPERLDRLRALGNSVVPEIPEIIGRAIIHTIGKGKV